MPAVVTTGNGNGDKPVPVRTKALFSRLGKDRPVWVRTDRGFWAALRPDTRLGKDRPGFLGRPPS